MPWIGAAVGVGGSLIGGALQGNAASKAAKQAAKAQREAVALQRYMFDTQNAQFEPYRQSGYKALRALDYGFGFPGGGGGGVAFNEAAPSRDAFTSGGGRVVSVNQDGSLREVTDSQPSFDQAGYNAALEGYNSRRDAFTASQSGGAPIDGISSGYFAHQFNAGDLNANLAPNWKFALDQGIGATKNAANLQTGLLSGNAMKGIADYTLGKSGDLYQQAFNNYTANQSNIFNRLSTVAGYGSAANTQSATLAGTLAPSMASGIAGAGAAQAAGTVGQANALAGGVNNALGWYQLSNMTRPTVPGINGDISIDT